MGKLQPASWGQCAGRGMQGKKIIIINSISKYQLWCFVPRRSSLRVLTKSHRCKRVWAQSVGVRILENIKNSWLIILPVRFYMNLHTRMNSTHLYVKKDFVWFAHPASFLNLLWGKNKKGSCVNVFDINLPPQKNNEKINHGHQVNGHDNDEIREQR